MLRHFIILCYAFLRLLRFAATLFRLFTAATLFELRHAAAAARYIYAIHIERHAVATLISGCHLLLMMRYSYSFISCRLRC